MPFIPFIIRAIRVYPWPVFSHVRRGLVPGTMVVITERNVVSVLYARSDRHPRKGGLVPGVVDQSLAQVLT